MGKYIRSHSKFRLATKHQTTKNGTIYERDISTIGGVSPLSAGQSKIYSSGNFIITINTESSASRHVVKKGWASNGINGDTWNGEVLQNQTSDPAASKESSIAYKNDYLNLRSFSCYGSLDMLIQSSIAGIIANFPFELFVESGSTIASNPGGISLYESPLDDTDKMKYLCTDSASKYSCFIDDSTEGVDITCEFSANGEELNASEFNDDMLEVNSTNVILDVDTLPFWNSEQNLRIKYNDVEYPLDTTLLRGHILFTGDTLYIRVDADNNKAVLRTDYCPESGDIKGIVSIKDGNGNKLFQLTAYYDKDLNVAYSGDSIEHEYHIRPKEELGYYDDFLEGLDTFQKALMGVYSKKPRCAKFEVISNYGGNISKKLQEFEFPLGEGGYNLAVNGFLMSNYVQDLTRIGYFYDENYTDNLYRLVTHESLKNFDWTRDFNGNSHDYQNEYITTGEKFKAIIRIIGYQFDKEKAYIDAIGNAYTLTYDDKENLADYFVSDSLEEDGWRLNNIYPYELKEFSGGNEIEESVWNPTAKNANYDVSALTQMELAQLKNKYSRQFSENNTEIVCPYCNKEKGLVYTCIDGKSFSQFADDDSSNYYMSNDKVYNVIRNYYDTNEYTMPDVTNEFYKRLRINSRYLLRKKGTIQGLSSLLSLFGLKGKRWCEAIEDRHKFTTVYDEASGELKYDDENLSGHGYTYNKYKKNLSHKLFYDFDIKEYTEFASPIKETWDSEHDMYTIDYYNSCKTVAYNTEEFLNGEYVAYQGLPVSYRDLDGVYCCESGETTSSALSLSDYGKVVPARRLYPDFMKSNEYDGGLYYMMKGSWMTMWPYLYDENNEIVENTNLGKSKETLRNVKQVKNIEALLSQPLSDVEDGMIYYVNDISGRYGVVDGSIYTLESDVDDDGVIHYYIPVSVYGGQITIGYNTYEGYFKTYDPYATESSSTYTLDTQPDGYVIKLYYNENDESNPFNFFSYSEPYYQHLVTVEGYYYYQECTVDTDGAILFYRDQVIPDATDIFINKSLGKSSTVKTNYFILNNASNLSELGDEGWSQLDETDEDYKRVKSIADDYEGNNPHSGGNGYDGGYDYIAAFSKLFNYASMNSYFNEECFRNIDDAYDKINSYGFEGLSDKDGSSTSLEPYIKEDTKVRAFIETYDESGNTKTIYNLDDIKTLGSAYSAMIGEDSDGVTSQIVNTKLIDLYFYLHATQYYSKEGQEEIKHYQDKIIPYVEQMVPSTAIMRVRFIPSCYKWVLSEDFTHILGASDLWPQGIWKDYFYWTNDGIWTSGVTQTSPDGSRQDIEIDTLTPFEKFIKQTAQLSLLASAFDDGIVPSGTPFENNVQTTETNNESYQEFLEKTAKLLSVATEFLGKSES